MYFNATNKTELSLAQDDMDGVTSLYPRQEPLSGQFLGCGTVERPGGGGFGQWPLLGELALWMAAYYDFLTLWKDADP